jgi:D-3-phosphoglycerate dehydrogenase
MKILVIGDSYCPSWALRPAFRGLGEVHEITFADVKDEPSWQPASASELVIREYLGSPAQMIGFLDRHDVLVLQAAPVTDVVLDACPSLRLVCVARGGPVNVDVAAATERGIPVVITPGKNAQAVTELVFGLMVMLARKIPAVTRYLEGGGALARDNYEGAMWFGHELQGKTLGLVGHGQVGQRVARLAVAWGMRVLVYDPFVEPALIVAAGLEPVALDDLLGRSDFVSLHARSTPENRGLIGSDAFARMKRGAILINTARDTLVDEDALYDALRSGRLGGAGLDVVRAPGPDEPLELGRRHRLLEMPNVAIGAHIGGSTGETLLRGGEMASAEIVRFATGEPLENVANRAALVQHQVTAR